MRTDKANWSEARNVETLSNTARLRPGGAPAISFPSSAPLPDNAAPPPNGASESDLREQYINTAFMDYVRKYGTAAEVHIVEAEINRSPNLSAEDTSDISREIYYWVANQILLANVLFTLLLGGLATLLIKTSWAQRNNPTPFGVRFGLGTLALSALVSGTVCYCQSVFQDNSNIMGWISVLQQDPVIAGQALFVVLVLGGIAGWLFRRSLRSGWKKIRVGVRKGFKWNVVHFMATISVCLGTLLAGGYLTSRAIAVASSASQIYSCYPMDAGTVTWPQSLSEFWFTAISSSVVLALPITLILALLIASRFARVPCGVGVLRGMRGLAGPITAMVLLLYAASAVLTSINEAQSTAKLQQKRAHQ